MKNFTIENAKTELFQSKEHYLQFRQAWKDFHNSDKLVWREDVEVYSWNLNRNVTMKNVKRTALGAEHYMLYNLLRGYDAQRGFREDSDHGWCACEYAAYNIRRAALRLKDVNSPYDSSRTTSRELIENMLLPFGGTVSHEMLMEVGKQITELFYGNNSSKYFGFEIEEWKEPEEKVTLKSKLKLWAEKV
jgi:hypothetical protein